MSGVQWLGEREQRDLELAQALVARGRQAGVHERGVVVRIPVKQCCGSRPRDSIWLVAGGSADSPSLIRAPDIRSSDVRWVGHR
jgi:hypothetical protein